MTTPPTDRHLLDRWLAVRTAAASPLALLLPLAVAGFELMERGELPEAASVVAGAVGRALLATGPLAPLLAGVIVIVSLRARGQWLALRLLGFARWRLLLPVGVAAALGAICLGVALSLLPTPQIGDVLPPEPARTRAGWLVPIEDRTLLVRPEELEVEQVERELPPRTGREWARARQWTFIPLCWLTLLLLPLWTRGADRPGDSPVSAALLTFVGVGGGLVVWLTGVGLLTRAGAWGVWTGAALTCALPAAGGAVVVWWWLAD